MNPATDSRIDYKKLVRDGYNACAAPFAAAREGGAPGLDLLLPRLSAGAEVLDLPYTEDFFGVPMFWTNFGIEEYLHFLQEIRYEVLETSVLGQGYGTHQPAEAHPL